MTDELARKNDMLDPTNLAGGLGKLAADELFPDDWTLAEKEQACDELFGPDGRVKTGYWSKIPRLCDSGCPHHKAERCPLSKKPYGEVCPEESSFVEMLMRGYIKYLGIRAEETPALSMTRDLVDVEIQQLRKMGELANASLLIEKNYFDKDGNIIATELVENPIFAIDDRLAKRKRDSLKTLHASREQEVKSAIDHKATTEMGRVATLLEKLSNQLPQSGEDIIDAEFVEVEDDLFKTPTKE